MKSLFFALTFASVAFAHQESTFYFATLPPSPAANGRAGIFFGPENADPLAAWSNPGLLGLMATSQVASASFYPERTQWLPGFDLWELKFSARGLFASWPQKSKNESSWLPLGITYTEQYLDLGETQRTDPSGYPIGSFRSYEVARSLHFGIAQQTQLWRFGAGTGIRYQYSDLSRW